MASGASVDVDILGSAVGAESECGGEGGRATEVCGAVTIAGGSAEAVGFISEVSILLVSMVEKEQGECADILSAQLYGYGTCRG